MKWITLIFYLLFFTSCVSLKQDRQSGIQKLNDLSAFNGVYQNVPDATEKAQLWSQLSLSDSRPRSGIKPAKIELKAIHKNQIKATWFEGDIPKQELILKGKLKDNYFVSRHKRTIIPIPLIYGEFENSQFQLALTEDHTLRVDRLQNKWGWVFLFLASTGRTSNYEYKNY